jgi:CHRD domain
MSRRVMAALVALIACAGLSVAVALGASAVPKRGPLFAALNGKKEVDQNGKKGTGDPDGAGSASFTFSGSKVCFGITVSGIGSPVAAHIHRGGPNVAGPVVVTLKQPASGTAGAASGCAAVTPSLAAAIRKNPGRYYANVHTQDKPAGAVRGQLFAPR